MLPSLCTTAARALPRLVPRLARPSSSFSWMNIEPSADKNSKPSSSSSSSIASEAFDHFATGDALRTAVTGPARPVSKPKAREEAAAEEDENEEDDEGNKMERIAVVPVVDAPASSPFLDIPPEHDPLLHFFTTSLMRKGKGAQAHKITSQTLLHIHTLTRAPPLPILRQAVEMASPAVRTVMHSSGGKAVARPMALSERQRTKRGIMWIIEASRSNRGNTLAERLARELIAVVQGESSVLKQEKREVHRFAMVSRGGLPSRM